MSLKAVKNPYTFFTQANAHDVSYINATKLTNQAHADDA